MHATRINTTATRSLKNLAILLHSAHDVISALQLKSIICVRRQNGCWWWSYEPFCLPVSAIARAHDPTVIGSVALRKGPRRFCPHRSDRCRSDRCRALMLTCRNSPLWQRCERCNNVLSSSWPPWLDQFMFNRVVIT